MSMSTPLSSPRCPTCKDGPDDPKNLVVFIDGTSNKPGPKKTNVKKLYDVIPDGSGHKQCKLYLEGIGAGAIDHLPRLSRTGRTVYNAFEMAFARNVGENVKKAYKWLAQTYVEGHQIYLFGFSRGAYQVRALAGMIHEVGLLKPENINRIDQAYHRYLSINPKSPESRVLAIEFKKDFCLSAVRIHFIGVWDTVSSLGLIKRNVHITASATVTNACHFRHALALDECRVNFMPEYFSELNAHRGKVRSRRSAVSDVEEVWFAGSHSDVGGISRPARAEGDYNPVDGDHNPVHAGNVSLLWMRREATAQGLDFDPKGFPWYPEDVDLGRKETMNSFWKFLEILPIRHQASFSGTGKHQWRWHLLRPRLVIPEQHIHFSVLPGDIYTPRATLANGVDLPLAPQKTPMDIWATEPWKSGLLDERATSTSLTLLLGDQHKTLKFLGEVLLLLSFRLDNKQTIPDPNWSEMSICEYSGLEKFVLVVIYDVIRGFSTPLSYPLIQDAKNFLKNEFSNQLCPGFFYVVRFSARHERLRQRLFADDEVIGHLIRALEQTARGADESLFPLVVDSLCRFVLDEGKRNYVINQLTAMSDGTALSDGTEPELTRLSLTLKAKAPSHLVASLNMIATLAKFPSFTQATDLCIWLRSQILILGQRERGLVGSAAVEALVALGDPKNVLPSIRISNIIGYLNNTLPRLDAEVGSILPSNVTDAPILVNEGGSTSSTDTIVSLFTVLQAAGFIPGELGEENSVMCKLLQTIESRSAHERTAATMALLKLCKYPIVRDYCRQKKVVDIFMRQSMQTKTSLMAVYALHMCLNHDMWTPNDFPCAAQVILTILDKGWLDGAVGRVEGPKLFGELLKSDDLRQQIGSLDIVTVFEKKLENGDPHEVRMSLICLEMLVEAGVVELEPTVIKCLTYLDKDRKTQKKGVGILSALAQTAAGEEAIKPHVVDIVKMLLPSRDRSPPPRSQLYGASAAVHGLCRNETLREQILRSNEYAEFRRLRYDKTLYPQLTGATRS